MNNSMDVELANCSECGLSHWYKVSWDSSPNPVAVIGTPQEITRSLSVECLKNQRKIKLTVTLTIAPNSRLGSVSATPIRGRQQRSTPQNPYRLDP
jgi:hypothetical protein